MIEESPTVSSSPISITASQTRTVPPTDESVGLHQRRPNRTCQDDPGRESRRRSSNLSDYLLKDAKNAFQSSTEELLFPKLTGSGYESSHLSSPWHSAPLAFALLPALAGVLFTNGSGIVTDIMLLGFAAIFLNWSVRLPWDWYHAARATRLSDENTLIYGKSKERENNETFLHDVPEERLLSEDLLEPIPAQQPSQHAASSELYRYESLALLSCFAFPFFGAYLLHCLRSQLKRPSEGLVSNYNLTIFLLASELRPMAHVVKLVQTRTLHLQKVVASKSRDKEIASEFEKDIFQRLEDLEARCNFNDGARQSDKQSNITIMELRKNLQPDFDALNRTVRRYEKRFTIQTFQTDSRLQELESQLNNYISLTAAAAANNDSRQGFSATDVIEWVVTMTMQPFHILSVLTSLSLSIIMTSLQVGKSWTTGRQKTTEKTRKPLNMKIAGKISSVRSREPLQGRWHKKVYD